MTNPVRPAGGGWEGNLPEYREARSEALLRVPGGRAEAVR